MSSHVPVTRQDLLDYLDKTEVESGENDELDAFLEAATDAAEGWAPKGRLAVGPIVSREFTDRVRAYAGRLYLPRAPVVSVSSATRVLDGQQFAAADLELHKRRGVLSRKTGVLPPGEYDVVHTAGRGAAADVPQSLKTGVLIIAGHLWETQQGPTTNRFIGDAGDEGFRVSAGYLIPNRAAHLLTPYCPIGAA